MVFQRPQLDVHRPRYRLQSGNRLPDAGVRATASTRHQAEHLLALEPPHDPNQDLSAGVVDPLQIVHEEQDAAVVGHGGDKVVEGVHEEGRVRTTSRGCGGVGGRTGGAILKRRNERAQNAVRRVTDARGT